MNEVLIGVGIVVFGAAICNALLLWRDHALLKQRVATLERDIDGVAFVAGTTRAKARANGSKVDPFDGIEMEGK
jgi:hypothetical protein